MSSTFYRADVWDRLNHMPAPDDVFHMTCDEGHDVPVTHRVWHMHNNAPCQTLVVGLEVCPGRVDLAHARRHASCPCDEDVTAPEPRV